MRQRIVILGAGGHARSVADVVLNAAGDAIDLAGFIDEVAPGTLVIGNFAVLGADRDLPALIDRFGLTGAIVGVGQVRGGDPIRARLFALGLVHGLVSVACMHKSSRVSAFATIGAGSVVMAGATINAGSVIGRNVIVNTGAIIDHDCVVGDHTHIAPGATLSGAVAVAEGTLIGVGAVIRQGIAIGLNATVGAGAVVIKDVADGQTVLGNPARPARRHGES